MSEQVEGTRGHGKCASCGRDLSRIRRLNLAIRVVPVASRICENCERDERHAAREAKWHWLAQANRLTEEMTSTLNLALSDELIQAFDGAGIDPTYRAEFCADLLNQLCAKVESTSGWEGEWEQTNSQIMALLDRAGAPATTPSFAAAANRWIRIRADKGVLPVVENSPIVIRPNESAHLCFTATHVEFLETLQYKGGFSGVTIPFGEVPVHVGQASGRWVSEGTKLHLLDRGSLTLTSMRCVFIGSRTAIEVEHSSLLSLDCYPTAVRFYVSERSDAPMFLLEEDGQSEALRAAVLEARRRHTSGSESG